MIRSNSATALFCSLLLSLSGFCQANLSCLAALASQPPQSPQAGNKNQAIAQTQRNLQTQTQAQSQASTAKSSSPVLKGGVSHEVCPFYEDGRTETIKEGTPLNLTVTANLNSELNKEGDLIYAEVASDLSQNGKVVLPGKWHVLGRVSRVQPVKRMGRDGFIEIKFEKLISPDGKWEMPLDASASTKPSQAKTALKQAAETTGYLGAGAFGGSLLSVQLTGLPVAISTYGISVGVGAAVGASVGLAAALHRKGDTLCAYPGDEIKIRLPNSITLPSFKQECLPSRRPPIKREDLGISIRDYDFKACPFGDKQSRLLKVTFRIENHSKEEFSFSNLALTCDHNHRHLPYCAADDFFKERSKSVGPNAVQEASITFQVCSQKHKYWLVLLDRGNEHILSQVAIN